ncbi:YfbU family protein [Microbacteriaceae bacterium 4G12]
MCCINKELKSEDKYETYNSHFPMLNKYRRMLSLWGSISEWYNNNLSLEEIKKIINA